MSNQFEVLPLGNIGAEVVGLAPGADLSPATAQALYRAWLEHGVLLFRGFGTDTETHLRLSRVFGELEEHPVKSILVPGQEELILLGGEGLQKGGAVVVDGEVRAGYFFFHQDTAYTPNICKGSMLRMVRKSDSGGETMWVDTQKAYAALPEPLKARIENLWTMQTYRGGVVERLWGWPGHTVRAPRPDEGPECALDIPDFPLVTHPMVIAHPETGKKSLLLSPMGFFRIDGMEQEEGDALFDAIVGHALGERFTYQHDWEQDDMVLWDNRRSLHSALGYPYHQTRIVYRTTLKGAMPTGRYYESRSSGTRLDAA